MHTKKKVTYCTNSEEQKVTAYNDMLVKAQYTYDDKFREALRRKQWYVLRNMEIDDQNIVQTLADHDKFITEFKQNAMSLIER